MKKLLLELSLLIGIAAVISLTATGISSRSECFNPGYRECRYLNEQVAFYLTSPGFIAGMFIQSPFSKISSDAVDLLMIFVNVAFVFLVLLFLKFLTLRVFKHFRKKSI